MLCTFTADMVGGHKASFSEIVGGGQGGNRDEEGKRWLMQPRGRKAVGARLRGALRPLTWQFLPSKGVEEDDDTKEEKAGETGKRSAAAREEKHFCY